MTKWSQRLCLVSMAANFIASIRCLCHGHYERSVALSLLAMFMLAAVAYLDGDREEIT